MAGRAQFRLTKVKPSPVASLGHMAASGNPQTSHRKGEYEGQAVDGGHTTGKEDQRRRQAPANGDRVPESNQQQAHRDDRGSIPKVPTVSPDATEELRPVETSMAHNERESSCSGVHSSFRHKLTKCARTAALKGWEKHTQLKQSSSSHPGTNPP